MATTKYYQGVLFFRIRGARRYFVSRCGAVLSTNRKRQPELMTGWIQSKGYRQVPIVKDDGTTWPALVHQLVALTFLRPKPGKDQVNHKDGTRLNNHVNNLEWVDNRENTSHAREMKLRRYGQHRLPFW